MCNFSLIIYVAKLLLEVEKKLFSASYRQVIVVEDLV